MGEFEFYLLNYFGTISDSEAVYSRPVFRKLKFSRYHLAQKSEAKFVNKVKMKYSQPRDTTRTYQAHCCTPKIKWLLITGILTDPEFKTFVIMIENTKIAVFDFIKNGIIAIFMVNYVSEYCILNSKILFQDKQIKTLIYDPHTEKFYWQLDCNIYRFDMHGETFIVNASARIHDHQGKLTDQREIIITDLSEQGSIKIPNESLVCSCRFKDNILIFSESGNNYKYYDIARNTAIDVGNFVYWLPDSLSFFENQTVLTNVNIIDQPRKHHKQHYSKEILQIGSQ